jgi:hypothetical protein
MALHGTDAKAESGSTLLIHEQDSDFWAIPPKIILLYVLDFKPHRAGTGQKKSNNRLRVGTRI